MSSETFVKMMTERVARVLRCDLYSCVLFMKTKAAFETIESSLIIVMVYNQVAVIQFVYIKRSLCVSCPRYKL